MKLLDLRLHLSQGSAGHIWFDMILRQKWFSIIRPFQSNLMSPTSPAFLFISQRGTGLCECVCKHS